MTRYTTERLHLFNFIKSILDIIYLPKITNSIELAIYKFLLKKDNFKYIGKYSKINLNQNKLLGSNITLGEFSLISSSKGAEIEIGNNVKLARNVLISSDFGGEIFIGKDTIIGPNTVIRSANHLLREGDYSSDKYVAKDIYIGSSCWIGANCVILAGTKLPDKCVVGALSVTNKEYKNASLICCSIATVKK